MSFTKATREIGVGLHALETIGKLAKGANGNVDQAVSILSKIVMVYDAVVGGLERGVDVGEIERDLKTLLLGGEDTNRAWQEALDAKFPRNE